MRLPALFATSILALSLSSQAMAGATLDRVESKKEMVNVLMESYPPFSFLNEKNELDGFDVDVAKAVAEKLGVKVRFETPSWDVISAGRWNGRYDICICSMTPSKVRAQVFDFPVVYYASPAVIVVNAKDDRIHSAKDLNGRKVGLTSASSYEIYLNKNLVIEGDEDHKIDYPFDVVQIVPYDTDNVAFQDLGLGAGVRLDAVLTNLVTAQPRLDKDKRFKLAGAPLYEEPNAVVLDKGDPEWNAKVREVFAELKADGTLTRLSEKWIGADISK